MKLQIILSSVRKERRGEKVAKWVQQLASQDIDLGIELIDLKDWPLTLDIDRDSELGQKWIQKINQADGYILVAPEYNHGYAASLKLALDYPESEWHKKPVGIVAYSTGMMGGGRMVEVLKLVLIELQMIIMPEVLTIPKVADQTEESLTERLQDNLQHLFDQLKFWNKYLSQARLENPEI